jgi:uncharacterized membrane protein
VRWRVSIFGFWKTFASLFALVILLLHVDASPNKSSSLSPPSRDINAVLRTHDRELLRLPHVVGVYVGLMADEKTPCLKVMLSREDAATVKFLPRTLEGYRVVAEVTGEIQPRR